MGKIAGRDAGLSSQGVIGREVPVLGVTTTCCGSTICNDFELENRGGDCFVGKGVYCTINGGSVVIAFIAGSVAGVTGAAITGDLDVGITIAPDPVARK